MGVLLNIIGLKALKTNSKDHLLRNFSIGFILCYDIEDMNKFVVASFLLNYTVSSTINVISYNTLSINGTGNGYGTIEVTGGSGNYQYNVFGF